MHKPRSRTLLGFTLGLVISALALGLVVRWSGWQQLRLALETVDLRFVFAALGVFLLSMVARAAAWQALLNWHFRFPRVIAVLNEGYLLSNVLPFRLGELGRAVLLGHAPGTSVLTVLSSILAERLYDVTLALSLLFILFPFAANLPGATNTAFVLAILVVGMLGVLLVLIRRSSWVEAVLNRLPGGMERWRPIWGQLRAGLRVLEDGRVFLASSLFMMISWALAGLEYWLVIRSVLPEAQLVWAYFMLTVTLLGAAIPSSPGYIGVFEAAGVIALSVFGVPRADALAAALILHAMVYIVASGLGLLAMTTEGETLSGLYARVQAWLALRANEQAF
jgi:uncharacterized protein (TIRG00374 family)